MVRVLGQFGWLQRHCIGLRMLFGKWKHLPAHQKRRPNHWIEGRKKRIQNLPPRVWRDRPVSDYVSIPGSRKKISRRKKTLLVEAVCSGYRKKEKPMLQLCSIGFSFSKAISAVCAQMATLGPPHGITIISAVVLRPQFGLWSTDLGY